MLISMDARLREGIRLFNAGRYFESHERFEELYVGAEEQHKPFIEGLIQIAAACRLVCDFGEIKGPVRMVHQALIRLENYQPTYLQVRVKGLIAGMEAWAKRAEAAKPAEVDRGAVREEIPKIRRRRFLFFG